MAISAIKTGQQAAKQKQVFTDHTNEVVHTFNKESARWGLGVELNADHLIELTLQDRNAAAVRAFYRSNGTGSLYAEQIKTAVEAAVQLIDSRYNFGLIEGALQSGKTTTALALQLICPAVYILTGVRLNPLYLTTNQNSHAAQMRAELDHFLRYYGEVDIRAGALGSTLKNYLKGYPIEPVFEAAPTLNNYRDIVLQGQLHDVYRATIFNDLIKKRVRGRAITQIASLFSKMLKDGLVPLLIIDEPQYGASDRIEKVNGQDIQRDCLLSQIQKEIITRIGDAAKKIKVIGLSATPFEIHELTRVWIVKQRLNPAYRGFNFLGGKPIDSSVTILPPDFLSLSQASLMLGVPFLSNVESGPYNRLRTFQSWASKNYYIGSHNDYKDDCCDSIRQMIEAIIRNDNKTENSPSPPGICIRAINDNDKTEKLLTDLKLNPAKIEVIRFYGGSGKGLTVKEAIAKRSRPDLPYVFMVTSKARMGDQFPSDVRYFADFTSKSADLNALLQGLVGRACGYNKDSMVILSDKNAEVLDRFIVTSGSYVAKPSRHSVVTGGHHGLEARRQLTIDRNPNDPTLEAVFKDIERQIVHQRVPDGPKMNPKRAPKGGRRGPVLTIAKRHHLFNYVESPNFNDSLNHVYGHVRLVRPNDSITITDKAGNSVSAKYLKDHFGNCRFNFRSFEYAGRGGIKGRGTGQRDSSNKSLNQGILEPSIVLRKRDPSTGEWLDDKHTRGEWVPVGLTLPLKQPCLIANKSTDARISLPGKLCVYDQQMTHKERARRDAAL